MRVTVQLFDCERGEGHPKIIYCDWDEVPLGMTPDRCAEWMLAKAQEKILLRAPVVQKRHD